MQHLNLDINREGTELGPNGRPMTSNMSQASMNSARKRQTEKLILETMRSSNQEWIDMLRIEFKDYINELFREKMKEFIDFIEEELTVDE